nr:uncharacterized protein LOC110370848 [Helicoverpa armigera]
MAPPPEYDKEPKAPDKSATNISTEDSKLLHNLVNDQHTNSDHKPINTVAAVEVENNKHVETLDDGQLRALLDEAITYKCPKDREGKSSLFKELLEEVEQDEQACEAAARTLSGCRGARRGGRGRRALPHSNSLQDLVAALAAEPAPRRHHVRHHPPAPAPSNVSARAIHGGSLPSGVDTSSLLSEEPARGAGYLATVRCVNPPPLAERRVSASDANTPAEMELLNRRSKPMFPMTYTARATLEIGSGSVCSGRAVTTTTASNQVRTPPSHRPGPQAMLLNALRPRPSGGGQSDDSLTTNATTKPRGPKQLTLNNKQDTQNTKSSKVTKGLTQEKKEENPKDNSQLWAYNVDNWYKTLPTNTEPLFNPKLFDKHKQNTCPKTVDVPTKSKTIENDVESNFVSPMNTTLTEHDRVGHYTPIKNANDEYYGRVEENFVHDYNECDIRLRREYRQKVGDRLVKPSLSDINPKNVRSMTIGRPLPNYPYASFKEANIDDNPVKVNKEKNTAYISTTQIDGGFNCNTNDADSNINITTDDVAPSTSKQLLDISKEGCDSSDEEDITWLTKPVTSEKEKSTDYEVEMQDVSSSSQRCLKLDELIEFFPEYVAKHQKLLESMGSNRDDNFNVTTREHKEETTQSVDVTESLTGNLSSDIELSTVEKCAEQCSEEDNKIEVHITIPGEEATTKNDRIILAQLPNNAYIFLTLPKPLVSPLNTNVNTPVQLFEIENSNDVNNSVSTSNNKPKVVKKKKQKTSPEHPVSTDTKKTALDKNVLKVLLFESLFKNNVSENLSHTAGVSAIADKEVDSAISFSCITTPEVVSSCNTTSSTAQSAVAVDPKPRSVISSSFNGLPLSRPSYGSTGNSATDDYKKSLDENGNSVQGFSSPLSGSSQHKKPRRKKSSKNETVIDCQQIDGYQGDKDVNELLRFIESNADNGRGAKLGRVKHKDDSDDKSGKKRSTERRKDKENKLKRASSLEELSRTNIDDLTDAAPDCAERREPAKPERRSWGDDALYDPDAVAETDFQTVTKKRKPRRRADEPPRRARAPSPRPRRESAPPSDRSNDSNDDMDSVHSLPAAPPAPPAAAPPAPVASYADIARTRHNIPDLIESCNFYAEPEPGAAAPADDGYPALAARRRDAKPPPPRRKERPPAPPRPPDCPAPDVVADRRPPVILLDEAVRPRDMDGVTFGFDVNEQLLSGAARRPRCDLVRDAAEAGVAVRAGCLALRYVPPAPPPDAAPLLQLVDYVGAAWEDVVRCGGGKVRYFSE